MRILALVNQKGGCGKTTTAIHLASRLAALGRRTVLVDLDPQGHATLGLGFGQPPPDRCVARVLSRSGLDERAMSLRSILVPVADNLRLAPTGAELAELEIELTRTPGGEERLAEHLAPLRHEADRVVIDAPPSLGMLTLNTLMAAGEILIPVEPSVFSLHGLARLTELTRLLTERSRHVVRFRPFLNAFDRRTRFARKTLAEIREAFPRQTLEATIRASVLVREATARGLPVDRFAPRSPVAQDYEALALELERQEATVAPSMPAGLVVRADGVYLTRNDVDPAGCKLAGDFNGWVPDSGTVLKRHGDGSWTKFFPLRPGRYEYKLVVDGQWVVDPLNPKRVGNDVGSMNSVLEVDA
jgi:chromosome partitioning protein